MNNETKVTREIYFGWGQGTQNYYFDIKERHIAKGKETELTVALLKKAEKGTIISVERFKFKVVDILEEREANNLPEHTFQRFKVVALDRY